MCTESVVSAALGVPIFADPLLRKECAPAVTSTSSPTSPEHLPAFKPVRYAARLCVPHAARLHRGVVLFAPYPLVAPHVFGQATRPPLTALPSEANKCANIELEKEPAPHELRDWIVSTREIVSNAFSYDSPYAMSWVMSVENASTIEELDEECLYPILDNRFNAALRKCITSKPIVAKISRLTEEAQVKRGRRLKSCQILFCLIEYLRPDEVGSQSFRTNELLRLSLGRAAGSGEPQLEKFLDKWEGLLGGITAPIDHHLLQHVFVFFEQVFTVLDA